ncbi:saccharopine dehydrogenase family protein [Novilysobacter antarcticus]|uniref:saccharopine dehydrogenase family protein n=1 Tax=Novilysobacter antarcticus TaxID=2862543 RepID=UPI001C9995F8|nr:saccharopine dehydrogenase NADP-binding domain-containing protein [Lysobacter antarcticus]
MKILALGGAGQEGNRTVRDLVAGAGVASVVIGDLNLAAADKLKEEIGSDKVSTVRIDATVTPELVKALKDVDVVITFVGPYYRFGVPILKAAIEAGCHYVDICDDAEPTADMLELHEQARQAGIVALVGCGVSPGTLNVIARDAANRLDDLEDLHFRWNVPSSDVEGDIGKSAAVQHGIHIVDGDVVQFLDGDWTTVPAMSGSERVTFPVLGECEAYYLGHPEPVTIPRYIKGLRNVTQKGGVLGLDGLLRAFRELGLTSDEPLQLKVGDVRPSDVAAALLGRMPDPDPAELPPAVSEFMLIATGKRDGKPVKMTYALSGRMGPLTGVPASIIAQMIGSGQISGKGVFAPEGCVDPDIFLAELAKRDITVKRSETGI